MRWHCWLESESRRVSATRCRQDAMYIIHSGKHSQCCFPARGRARSHSLALDPGPPPRRSCRLCCRCCLDVIARCVHSRRRRQSCSCPRLTTQDTTPVWYSCVLKSWFLTMAARGIAQGKRGSFAWSANSKVHLLTRHSRQSWTRLLSARACSAHGASRASQPQKRFVHHLLCGSSRLQLTLSSALECSGREERVPRESEGGCDPLVVFSLARSLFFRTRTRGV